MTEQERPRTAEGRALIRDLMAWEPGAVESYRLEARIAAIEAEGRQQAVREIRHDASARWNERGGRLTMAGLNAILDRVAGLNASESPPHQHVWNDDGVCACGVGIGSEWIAEQGLLAQEYREHLARCPHCQKVKVGDASESPPHDPQHAYKCAVPWCPKYVGDASESGQPHGSRRYE